jgi:hypothetical protein
MMPTEPADDLAAADGPSSRLIQSSSTDHTVMTFSVSVPAAPDYPSPGIEAGNPALLQSEGGFRSHAAM